jgi:hypothetical protein
MLHRQGWQAPVRAGRQADNSRRLWVRPVQPAKDREGPTGCTELRALWREERFATIPDEVVSNTWAPASGTNHLRIESQESGYGYTSEPISVSAAAILPHYRDPSRVKWEEMVRKRTVEKIPEQICCPQHCNAHAFA